MILSNHKSILPIDLNCPSSDRVSHGSIVIPYVRGISEKYQCNGNCVNIRNIFKTKCTLHGPLMTTRPDTDVKQTRQCMSMWLWQMLYWQNRPLEVCKKEHKHNLRQGLWKNQNWPNMHTKKATKYTGTKPGFYKLNLTSYTGNIRN
jgi:hypothetical protein